MYAKVHSYAHGKILAACDEDLIGKKLKNKDLNIKVSESFYKGEIVDNKKLKMLFKEVNSINLIGRKVVDIAIKEGLAKKEHCIYFGKIPHLQIFKV